jgi:hypothetical protein
MSIKVTPIALPARAPTLRAAADVNFDKRWAAWQAKDVASGTRGNWAYVLPILLIAAAVITALLGR